MKRNVQNILSVYHQATDAEKQSGADWYADANREATAMHDDTCIGAAIIAAVSPGLRWEGTILAAKRIIRDESLDGLGVRWYDNVHKARRILSGESPDKVLGGLKVRAFWNCICNPSDWYNVCIDGHAYAIWQGKRISINSGNIPHLDRRGRYQKIAMDYHRAADEVGLLPMQLQATTWVAYRRLQGITFDN